MRKSLILAIFVAAIVMCSGSPLSLATAASPRWYGCTPVGDSASVTSVMSFSQPVGANYTWAVVHRSRSDGDAIVERNLIGWNEMGLGQHDQLELIDEEKDYGTADLRHMYCPDERALWTEMILRMEELSGQPVSLTPHAFRRENEAISSWPSVAFCRPDFDFDGLKGRNRLRKLKTPAMIQKRPKGDLAIDRSFALAMPGDILLASDVRVDAGVVYFDCDILSALTMLTNTAQGGYTTFDPDPTSFYRASPTFMPAVRNSTR